MDGSKDAVTEKNRFNSAKVEISKRMSNFLSVYTVEVYAIWLWSGLKKPNKREF